MAFRPRVAITGAEGLLGANLIKILCLQNEVLAVGRREPHFQVCQTAICDITKVEDMQILQRFAPHVVINCAALTNVDYCEEHPEEATQINATGVQHLAACCDQLNAYLIHISSDSVFDGAENMPIESSLTRPINAYGHSKWQGEQMARAFAPKHVVLRVTIYGWNALPKYSLAEWMLAKFKEGHPFNGFEDIIFTPILINNLAQVIAELIKTQYIGTLHIASPDAVSKLEFGQMIANIFGYDASLIRPVKGAQIPFKAQRQTNMCLNVQLAQTILNTPLLGVREGLQWFKQLQDEGYPTILKNLIVAKQSC